MQNPPECRFGLRGVSSGQAVLIDAEAHDPFGKAQLPRGSRTVSLAQLERVDDQLFFQDIQLYVERPGAPIGDLGHLQARRKQPSVDDPPIGEQYRPLDRILQFSDIPWPMIGHQQIDRRGGEPYDGPFMPPPVLLDEVIRQENDVGTALPQRRLIPAWR